MMNVGSQRLGNVLDYSIGGFPKIGGTILGDLIPPDKLYWGPLIWRNYSIQPAAPQLSEMPALKTFTSALGQGHRTSTLKGRPPLSWT